jgi:hypothetical protein
LAPSLSHSGGWRPQRDCTVLELGRNEWFVPLRQPGSHRVADRSGRVQDLDDSTVAASVETKLIDETLEIGGLRVT